MSSIFVVSVEFEDWDSHWDITIAQFLSKKLAEDCKNKWEKFFKESQNIFLEPDGWNPKLDEYYNHPYYISDDVEYGLPGTERFEWQDSKAYEDLVTRYDSIRHFKGIRIVKFTLDEDLFLESPFFDNKSELLKILKLHNRDWSINKIIK
jgi:hypothetical protein